MESVPIWSFSGPYFPAFRLNTERYSASVRIQCELVKIRTIKTANKDTFHAWNTVEFFLHERKLSQESNFSCEAFTSCEICKIL